MSLDRVTETPLQQRRRDLAFDQEIRRPELHRLHVNRVIALTGHQNDRDLAAFRRDLAKQFQSIAQAQTKIQQIGIMSRMTQRLEPCLVSAHPIQFKTRSCELRELPHHTRVAVSVRRIGL